MQHPVTPDGRYFVVRGRLWRCSNPALTEDARSELTRDLMSAWREKRDANGKGDVEGRAAAKEEIQTVKTALGERGPVWWTDTVPRSPHRTRS